MGTRHHHAGKFFIITSTVAMILALIGPMASPATAGETQQMPLDIAAMTLRPADLDAQGLTGFGQTDSILTDRPDAAQQFVDYWGWDAVVDDGSAFLAANARRTSILHLTQDAIHDGYELADALVASFVMEYDSAADASEGFNDAAYVWTDSLRPIEPENELWDERLLIKDWGQTFYANTYQRWILLFRVDNIVAGFSVHPYTRGTLEQPVIEALGARLTERIATVRQRTETGLGTMILRLQVDGDRSNNDFYTVEGGEAIPLGRSLESADEFAAFEADVQRHGIVEQYDLEQLIFIGDFPEQWAPYAWFRAVFTRFNDNDAAAAYLEELAGDIDPADHRDVPDLGDEALAIESRDAQGHHVSNLLVRSGDLVFRFRHITETDRAARLSVQLQPQPGALETLARHQLTCIQGEASCEFPVAIPQAMRDVGTAGFPVIALPAPASRLPAADGQHCHYLRAIAGCRLDMESPGR